MNDEYLLLISSLQHYVFCKRRFALVHIEKIWEENFFTASGKVFHSHVDSGVHESRRTIHIASAVHLKSIKYGLVGVADVVEFNAVKEETDSLGRRVACAIAGKHGLWCPVPVEYKSGKLKNQFEYAVQLCAQALCLEEMLNVHISKGVLYFGKTRRREEVSLDEELRNATISAIEGARKLLIDGVTPSAEYTKACEACSIKDVCQPKYVASGKSARRWIERNLAEVAE